MSTAVAEPVVANNNAVKTEVVATPASTPATVPAAAAPGRLLSEVIADGKPAAVASDATKPADAPAKVEDKAAAAPAEWSLAKPEGVEIADADLKAVEIFAKENGISKVQAEKILSREVASRTAAAETQKAEAARIGDVWMEEAQKHPEIGGVHLAGAVANAQKVLLAIATPEERKTIAATAFGNNPMFIAMLNRAAKLLPTEDVTYKSAQTEPVATSYAQTVYGKVRKY